MKKKRSLKKGLVCPCCKYQPVLNKDGRARKGFKNHLEISIAIPIPQSWDHYTRPIGFCCPKCGILFRELES